MIDERNKENQRLEEMRIQAALKMQEEEEAARKEEERLKKVEEESRRKLEERRKREEEVAAARQRSEKRKLESGDGGSSMKDGRFVSPSPVLPSRKLQFEGKVVDVEGGILQSCISSTVFLRVRYRVRVTCRLRVQRMEDRWRGNRSIIRLLISRREGRRTG